MEGLRHTALKINLVNLDLKKFKIKLNGGPFTAAAYCWDQAIQYLSPGKRRKEAHWLNKNINQLKQMDKKYKKI